MKIQNIVPVAAASSLFLTSGSLSAVTTIISADFTGATDAAAIAGTSPNLVNTPGNQWVQSTGQPGLVTRLFAPFGNSAPGVSGRSQGGNAIELNGPGLTVASDEVITIAADFRQTITPSFNTGLAGGAAAGRGWALGYYSSVGSGNQFSQNSFTGIVIGIDGGLNVVQDPNATGFFGAGSTLGTAVPFGGTFDREAYYTLSYTIDRGTGAITDLSLSGSTADYSSLLGTTLFDETATAFAGVYTSGTTSTGLTGAMDNFSVGIVPEPSSVALLALSGMGLLRRRR